MISSVRNISVKEFRTLNFYSPKISDSGVSHSCISIFGTEPYEMMPPKINKSLWNNVLQLQFDDITDNYFSGINLRSPLIMFGDNHAEQILTFLDVLHSSKTQENLIIHCFAGVSRSAAVAKFVSEKFLDDQVTFANNQAFNPHVYDTLQKISSGRS